MLNGLTGLLALLAGLLALLACWLRGACLLACLPCLLAGLACLLVGFGWVGGSLGIRGRVCGLGRPPRCVMLRLRGGTAALPINYAATRAHGASATNVRVHTVNLCRCVSSLRGAVEARLLPRESPGPPSFWAGILARKVPSPPAPPFSISFSWSRSLFPLIVFFSNSNILFFNKSSKTDFLK